MTTSDTSGRPWAKLSELRAGDEVELDGHFTCSLGARSTVLADHDGRLYFRCGHGRHHLDGQADDGEHCIGVYHAR